MRSQRHLILIAAAALLVSACSQDTLGPVCGACDAPPDTECSNATDVIRYEQTGTCGDDCEFTPRAITCEFDCNPATGECNCREGCLTPPAPAACYAATGTCESDACVYEYIAGASCDDGDICTQNDVCANATCAGEALICPEPPPECIGNTARVYDAMGTCDAAGECDYTFTDTPCEPTETCIGGSCVLFVCDTLLEVPVSEDPNNSLASAIIWTGSEYIIVWNNADVAPSDSHIMARRFATDSSALSAPQQVDTGANVASGLRVLFTGTELAMVWSDLRDLWNGVTNQAYFARSSLTGSQIGDDLPLSDPTLTGANPSIAWNDTLSEHLIVWEKGPHEGSGAHDLRIIRLASDATVVAATADLIDGSGTSYNPSLVYTGSQYGLAWIEGEAGTGELHFTRLSATAELVGAELTMADATSEARRPELAWGPGEFGLLWNDRRHDSAELYFARISVGGATLGNELRVTAAAGDVGSARLVWTGSEWAAAWIDDRTGAPEVYLRRISGTGAPSGPILRITCNGAGKSSVGLAWDGTRYAVVWSDWTAAPNREVFLRTITP